MREIRENEYFCIIKVINEGECYDFIFINEKIKCEYSGGDVINSSIELKYNIVDDGSFLKYGKGSFCGSYRGHKNGGALSLTSLTGSGGAVFLDIPNMEGKKIGTYLMNKIVVWGKQWPNSMVNSIELMANQATKDNKERRNRFYEQFGIIFNYSDHDKRSGISMPMTASQLKSVDNWREKIVELDASDIFKELLVENKYLKIENKNIKNSNNNLYKMIKDCESRSIIRVIKDKIMINSQYIFIIILLLIIAASLFV